MHRPFLGPFLKKIVQGVRHLSLPSKAGGFFFFFTIVFRTRFVTCGRRERMHRCKEFGPCFSVFGASWVVLKGVLPSLEHKKVEKNSQAKAMDSYEGKELQHPSVTFFFSFFSFFCFVCFSFSFVCFSSALWNCVSRSSCPFTMSGTPQSIQPFP